MSKLAYMAIGLVLVSTPAWAEDETASCETGGVTIHADGTPEDLEAACEQMEGFLSWTEGSTSTDALEERLVRTGFFATSTCTPDRQGVTCRAQLDRIVRDFDLDGRVPWALLRDDVRRRVSLRRGEPLPEDESALREQEHRLTRYFGREGYFDTKVRVTAERIDDDTPNAEFDVLIELDVGWSADIDRVFIRGRSIISKDDIEDIVHSKVLWIFSKRFRPEDLDDKVDEITEAIRDEGYPGARVRARHEIHSDSEKVDLHLSIDPGPQLLLEFEGNEELDDDDLEDVVTFWEVGAADSYELEQSQKAIVKAYQEDGYYAATVDAELRRTDTSSNTLTARFEVNEGEERTIQAIELEGFAPWTFDDLDDELDLITRVESTFSKGRWVEEWIEADRRKIESFLHSQGHVDAKVEVSKAPMEDEGLKVSFSATKGPARRVGGVRFEGLPESVPEESVLEHLALVEGAPFDEERLQRDEAEVVASLAEAGFTQASLEQTVEGDVVVYAIDAGKQATFGGVLVRGAFRTRLSLIKERLDLEPGEPLNLVKLGRAKRDLRSLGIFGSLDLRPLPPSEDGTTWVAVGLQESNVQSLDLAIAFTTDDLFSVGSDFRDRNVFGRAWVLDLGLRWANASEFLTDAKIGRADRFSARMTFPQPFRAPFDVTVGFQFDRENRNFFDERRISFMPAIERQWTDGGNCDLCPSIRTVLGYELVDTRYEPKEDAGEPPPDVAETTDDRGTIGRVVPSVRFEGLDDPIDPKKGYKARLRLELATPYLSPIPDGAQFWRIMASVVGYVNLGSPLVLEIGKKSHLGGPLVLATSVSTGFARIFGARGSIPTSETFYYGGDQSVRGLSRRASQAGKPGATNVLVASGELRWYMFPDLPIGALQLAGFVDMGTVAYSVGDLFADNTVSVGPALRLVTVVGPLSLAYGFPVIVDPDIEGTDVAPSRGRLHFTFGYSF